MEIPNGCTVVLDYDCTLTVPEDLSRKFKRGYLGELAKIVGQPVKILEQKARDIEKHMRQHPEWYDWMYNGLAVSSMVGDPSLRFIAIVKEIMASYPSDIEDVERFQHELFWRHYPNNVRLRPGVHHLLSQTNPSPFIVTNSPIERVRDKLSKKLSTTTLERLQLMGEAGKQWVDESFDRVESELRISGLDRPVLLKRRRYFEALSGILEIRGIDWSNLVVVGDNFEMDLSLPVALGAHAVLIASDFTPKWEVEYVQNHLRGRVITSLLNL